MRWSRVCIEAIAYELPDERVTSSALEARLAPVYEALRLGGGQLEALTGIRERRWWPKGPVMSDVAARAGRKALEASGLRPEDLGAVIYGGVARDNLEPATACAVAESLGLPPEAVAHDLSSACLGMLEGVVELANRIELGQIRAGLVVGAESAREIVEQTIARMIAEPTLERLRLCLATLTGGSGAAAIVLTDSSISDAGHRLLGGAFRSAPQHHRLCRWGPTHGLLGDGPQVTDTDASAVLVHGIELAKQTWPRFLDSLKWRGDDLDKVVCHQVGSGNRRTLLDALSIPDDRDFFTFPTLGNTGSTALPIAAAMAAEQGFLAPGDRVGLLGIGSGLNCLMLGLQW
ncbi:3-oxoacyl-ACP synthase III [Vulgatibacter incomptus]|uniref:3-oxoacyl-[ACP] synthase III in alkane synthesis cluster n=1 Tax=Vulgatibacter incomptus TaxID=1391653 RepID=A0A0K1PEU7_9BACT|nr:3-oxoacyl-ACP synthase III [Vulgatibacter incomptus]AKU92027.1 3-oxoacyl-[ACP] synthase III in alkane synthesis cluster [Vulgatibacter incomptus]